MRISATDFGGERPKAMAWSLGNSEAQLAIDCEVVSGGIRAIRENSFVQRFDFEPLTIHFFEDTWLAWEMRVSVAESPIGVDTPRIYWTGDGAPKQSTVEEHAAGKSYRLGVPTPTAPYVASVTGTADEEYSSEVSVLYTTSFVNKWGEEGDMSAPSNTKTYQLGQVISISRLGAYTTNDETLEEYRSVVSYRLYRLDEGDSRFVAEYPITVTEVEDDTGSTVLGEAFASDDFVPPPEDMQGLHVMSNDVALGFVDRTVYVSEPGKLNAWPYYFPVRSEIVGISSFDNTAVILTKGYPEVATIYDPQNISPSMMAEREPCVSQWSIVQAASGVMYATPSGIYYIGPSGGQSLTNEYTDREQWQLLKPETIHAAYRDGEYYAWHEGEAEGSCLVFDTRESTAVLRQLSAYVPAAHVQEGTDEMFVVEAEQLAKFQGGEGRLTYRWKSKEYGEGNPYAMTCARVISREFGDTAYNIEQAELELAFAEVSAENATVLMARSQLSVVEGYGGAINQNSIAGADWVSLAGADGLLADQPAGTAINGGGELYLPDQLQRLELTVTIYADSTLSDMTSVDDQEPYRLAYYDRVRHWEFELEGTVDINQFDMAGSESELHDVS